MVMGQPRPTTAEYLLGTPVTPSRQSAPYASGGDWKRHPLKGITCVPRQLFKESELLTTSSPYDSRKIYNAVKSIGEERDRRERKDVRLIGSKKGKSIFPAITTAIVIHTHLQMISKCVLFSQSRARLFLIVVLLIY
jgi:hypothetical protein